MNILDCLLPPIAELARLAQDGVQILRCMWQGGAVTLPVTVVGGHLRVDLTPVLPTPASPDVGGSINGLGWLVVVGVLGIFLGALALWEAGRKGRR